MMQNQVKFSFNQIIRQISAKKTPVSFLNMGDPARAYTIKKIVESSRKTVVLILPHQRQLSAFISNLNFFLKGTSIPVYHYPAYNISPFKSVFYHNETSGNRIRSLYRLMVEEAPFILVTSVEAVIQKVIPKDSLAQFAELIMAGEQLDIGEIAKKLYQGGYSRTMIVEEPGDYCVRGGILDVFTPLYDHPVRIEFFGDLVESIRFFSATTQRTLGTLGEVTILPAKEAIIEGNDLSKVIYNISMLSSDLGVPVAQMRNWVEQLSTQGIFPGIESLIPLIYDGVGSVFDYVSERAVLVLNEPKEIESAAKNVWEDAFRYYDEAREQKRLCMEPKHLFFEWLEFKNKLEEKMIASFQPLSLLEESLQDIDKELRYHCEISDNSDLADLKSFHLHDDSAECKLQKIVGWIKAQQEKCHSVVLAISSPSRLELLMELFKPYEIYPKNIDSISNIRNNEGFIYSVIGSLSNGFVWDELALSIVTDTEILGRGYRTKKGKRQGVHTELLSLHDLKKDDFVVHLEHGIGKYSGLVKLKLNGSVNDYLLILYRDDDKLYLPVERMGLIQKYAGIEGIIPVMDRMGGKSWEKVKEKIKKSTQKMAGELLKIYSLRKVNKGHSFVGEDSYFKEFVSAFPYQETDDQLKAIDDVLEDMRSPSPMDRLVCGDVGYGKTEVALRASFVAVSESTQVAVLVPTTVLAEQHFNTFSERYENYPVNIACLSRFRSPSEQRKILKDLKDGKLDIIIGTHRIIQNDVVFQNLGLLIVDEEHRFGVRHKEKIKKYRNLVDVLTLTATPIPRTLHMSLLGVRDISVISSPPEERHPIITYVSEYSEQVIREAVHRELDRKGQIFFVHNNVQTIERVAGRLKQLIPDVRIGVAHGQMPEDSLERVMMQFMQHEIDLLVCTTIIESGIDISSANTIIVNRADRFGLSQIYQLRGRVGRADEQAYAYLFIPPESDLSEKAVKRLKVLMEHSDLGSGFQIAMNDLKIRGGGTILGDSQSGHIAAVGYDMFLKLMEESINELKGEPSKEELEPEIHLPVSAFLSEEYIADIDQRLLLYRRLAKMTQLKQIADMKEELNDRFGKPPEEANHLLLKIMLKILAVKAGIKRLDLIEQKVYLSFSESHQPDTAGIVQLVSSSGDKVYQFTSENTLCVQLTKIGTMAMLGEIKNILIHISQHANNY